jgi:hypothetical protein
VPLLGWALVAMGATACAAATAGLLASFRANLVASSAHVALLSLLCAAQVVLVAAAAVASPADAGGDAAAHAVFLHALRGRERWARGELRSQLLARQLAAGLIGGVEVRAGRSAWRRAVEEGVGVEKPGAAHGARSPALAQPCPCAFGPAPRAVAVAAGGLPAAERALGRGGRCGGPGGGAAGRGPGGAAGRRGGGPAGGRAAAGVAAGGYGGQPAIGPPWR